MSTPKSPLGVSFVSQSRKGESPRFRLVRAEAMGWCFGVRDAVQATRDHTAPEQVAIHGELVHNREVANELEMRGFEQRPEAERAAPYERPQVLITAHGISDAERARLESGGSQLIDTTCPLVTKAHRAAQQLSDEGRFVVVVGRAGHVEVLGLTGDLDQFAIVAEPAEVKAYPSASLGVVFQTTTADSAVPPLLQAIRQHNPGADIVVKDTICEPTRKRQRAMARLVEECDFVVVVGGANSNNTLALVQRCREAGVPAERVAVPGELQAAWFEGAAKVGITAGTSTPDSSIEAVAEALEAMAARD